ncbi:uncharacterized protein EDB93DRAFT_1197093 [Suillus bovinus]|uniref:uncharacterized protein n=1 Tax=Suillus bovinus TaxID=48563 RepID=UPI001B85CD4E|nr:uncharacterized protein EDB93DRAFT_1197093 [Suillus bovinus]KAG2160162.1 hypothetical protein EDB93DRAFT_1197093 [Suillus bovinus]
MPLLTTSAAEADFPSSSRILHISPSLPNLYSSSHRLRRSRSPPMNTAAALSSIDLQQHIYNSLLESRTADVSLHVHGTWEAIYELHRVILIQSGFFSSLFTSGFLESSPKLRSHLQGPEEINVTFDDRNITRAAFEICIARLYGGGPPLYVPPSLVPTTSQPLTPSFSSPSLPFDTPEGYQTASPQLLLSLLATSVYLSIPSMASQAVNCIMNTVGPYTVIPYLNFAIGKAIEAGPDQKAEAAVGLENIAQLVTSESRASITSRSPLRTSSVKQDPADDLSDKLLDLDVQKEDPAESNEVESEPDDGPIREPHFHYGLLSDKIGEAAACWIARWGADMLIHEKKASRNPALPATPVPVFAQNVSSRKRADTMPAKPSPSNEPTVPEPHVTPVIWARGGLNSKWVRHILGSDLLFVKGEKERYDMACTIVELRRRQGIDEEEEKDWEMLFREGIYYANLLVDDIIAISQHISPTTGRPFVPLSVLQEAHWDQSLLRCQITNKPNSSSPSSPSSSPPPSREKELGLSITTAEILARLPASNSSANTVDKSYHPVGHDSSTRIGDSGSIEGTSMDQLFESPPPLSSPITDNKAPVRATTTEADFFGLKSERQTAIGCIASDATGKVRWSPYPPFRFAVEFWDIDALKEKSRLHSQTIWYAGSLFNVYVQVIRKKGIQLGVYLHRQSNIDPIPAPSAPLSLNRTGHAHNNRVPSLPQLSTSQSSPSVATHYSPSIHPPSRSTTPSSSPPTSSGIATSFTSSPSTIPATSPAVAPVQPYRDPRPAITAYFTISCASSTGSSITRFTSVPDVFSVSQSWGWKSSSLRTEYLEVGPDGQPAEPTVPAPRLNSLRATIVLGVV